MCHLVVLLGAHHILHVSRIRVKDLALVQDMLVTPSLCSFAHFCRNVDGQMEQNSHNVLPLTSSQSDFWQVSLPLSHSIDCSFSVHFELQLSQMLRFCNFCDRIWDCNADKNIAKFWFCASVHHSISQMKHQLDATLCRFYFCRVTLHVSGASAHHQVYLKLARRPLVHVFCKNM